MRRDAYPLSRRSFFDAGGGPPGQGQCATALEADNRFGAWMRRSLTLKNRDMFVAAEAEEVHGYVIASPFRLCALRSA